MNRDKEHLATGEIALRSVGFSFAVVGMQRGGSTYVADCLSRHPSIGLPMLELPLVEDPWWSQSVAQAQLQRVVDSVGPHATTLGLKRPDVLGQPALAQRLRSVGINRVVVSIRNPVERTISAAFWYMYVGRIPVPEDLNEYLSSLIGSAEMNLLSGYESELIEWSRVGTLTSRWMDEMNGEVFLTSSRRIDSDFETLLGFLGSQVSSSDRHREGLGSTGTRARRNDSIRDLRRLRFLRGRLRYSSSWDSTNEFVVSGRGLRIRNALHRRAVVAGYHAVDRARTTFLGTEESVVSTQNRVLLREYFDDEIRRFASISGPGWVEGWR